MGDLTCVYCEADVQDLCILCADCCGYILLCPQCFACGAEIGNHTRTHRYNVFSPTKKKNWKFEKTMSFSEEPWSPSDEVKFLRYMIRGYGRWKSVSEQMDLITSEDVEKHYLTCYLYGDIGDVTLLDYDTLLIKDHTDAVSDEGEESSSDSSNEGPHLPKSVCKNIGYIPHIGFYKEQFDSDAENIIETYCTGFEINGASSCYKPTNLEVACIHIYRNKVLKRHKIEEMISKYNLVKAFADSLSSKSSRTSFEKSEISLRNELKAYCRLLPPAEYETLILGQLAEKKLIVQFQKLKEKYLKVHSGKSPSKSHAKSDQTRSKQSKSKENMLVKSIPVAGSKESGISSKEIKSPSNTDTSGKRKRPFQEEHIEVSYSETCSDLLSQSEKRLCSTLGLEASAYMALKIVLFRDQNLNKELKNPVCNASAATREKVCRVTEFMSPHGWIRNS